LPCGASSTGGRTSTLTRRRPWSSTCAPCPRSLVGAISRASSCPRGAAVQREQVARRAPLASSVRAAPRAPAGPPGAARRDRAARRRRAQAERPRPAFRVAQGLASRGWARPVRLAAKTPSLNAGRLRTWRMHAGTDARTMRKRATVRSLGHGCPQGCR
jgi:hypothetical protein